MFNKDSGYKKSVIHSKDTTPPIPSISKPNIDKTLEEVSEFKFILVLRTLGKES